MRRRIPSIEALIAFECAARHESFTRSADELFLTQSAVSRQIACLEEYLGVPLFNRIKKRLSLTDVGRAYAKQVRGHLERIERDTLAAMAHQGAGGILELAVIPTFATRWLIPRLPQFYAQHPEITLNLTTRAEPFMFNDTVFDAAIHFGSPIWPGAIAHHLFGEEMTPVCSPRLMEGRKTLRPVELARLPLLHQSARAESWRHWFVQAGVNDVPCMKGQRYELFSMLVEAARAGLGVALMPRFLVLNELASGQLVIPCDIPLRNEKGYFLVYPEYKQESLPLKVFGQWLLATARQYSEADQDGYQPIAAEADYAESR
ncbi:transcriptional regulator GcvA [Herbaspirillum sp. HC18]|nr:transcriptional regulator GcvA [Herbaspirillum sp. HC18]